LLCKYVSGQWGIERTTGKTKSRIEEILKTLNFTTTMTAGQSFIWKSNQEPNRYEGFRVPQDGEMRELESISKEEVANALAGLLSQHISVPKDDLLKTVVKLFGYKSASKKSLSLVEYGLSHLVENGKCRTENGVVQWLM
jgi:hypothetical protein